MDEPDDNISGRSDVIPEVGSGLAALPHLTGDELEELHLAIKERMNTLAKARMGSVHAGNDDTVAEIDRRGLLLQSLDTAVQEARASLR